MHTEKQAAETWCPIRRHGDGGVQSCVGSRCAMWRWAEPEPWQKFKLRTGYCGLAGKPEFA